MNPNGTCRGGVQQPAKTVRRVPTTPRGTEDKEGAQAPPSNQISAWSLWQGVSWLFLPKEVCLFCDTCAEFDGDKACFVAIRYCFTIYTPCIIVERKFAVLLSWFPFHVGDEKQIPDGKKTHPVQELGRKEEEKAAGCPKGHHFTAAGRGRDRRVGNGMWRDKVNLFPQTPTIPENRLS